MIRDKLINNIDKVHTTILGEERIKRNSSLNTQEIIKKILSKESIITLKGKNYYIEIDNLIITVNKTSYTIITVHQKKEC